MKAIKLTKRMLQMNPVDLLIKIGAACMDRKMAFPQFTYMEETDYKTYEKNLVRKEKKSEKEYARPTSLIKTMIAMELLQYGPSTFKQKLVKKGYIVIDTDGIEREKIEHDNKKASKL